MKPVPQSPSPPSVGQVVETQALLDQLGVLNELVRAARIEVLKYPVLCIRAQWTGLVPPYYLEGAATTAQEIELLMQQYVAIEKGLSNSPLYPAQDLRDLGDELTALTVQINAVMVRLLELKDCPEMAWSFRATQMYTGPLASAPKSPQTHTAPAGLH